MTKKNLLSACLVILACEHGDAPPCDGFDCTTPASLADPGDDSGGSDESPSAPTSEGSAGSSGEAPFCSAEDTHCVGDNGLVYCDKETQKIHNLDCGGLCGSSDLPSLGCAGSDEGDVCYCGDPAESCDVAGESQCLGAAIRDCEGGVWEYRDCDKECVAAGYDGANEECDSIGSFDHGDAMTVSYNCSCRGAGVGCLADSQYCDAQGQLKYCYAGTWETYSCDEACGWNNTGEGLACGFRVDAGGETCSCT